MKRLFPLIFLLFLAISAVGAHGDNLNSDNSTLSEAISSDDFPSDNDDFPLELGVCENSAGADNASPLSAANEQECIETADGVDIESLAANSDDGNVIQTAQDSKFSAKSVKEISGNDVISTYGKQARFSVTLLDKQGNPVKNQLVTFKVANKKLTNYTNANGTAGINLALDAGTYTIKYSADGISGKNSLTVKNHYKIGTYKWKTGAKVTKNRLIKDNIPNSKAVKKVVRAAKSGTPVIRFRGGKGKTVFITSGVHGNELSSQVAAMQLIEYLETHPVKGTVYIMPFMHPKATSKNVRDYSVKLNSNANVRGTVSYKTVRLIVKAKASGYGDFHCTRPGGKPGKDVAMGTYKPTGESAKLAKYISKKSKVENLIYEKAGVEYPGALEDVVSLKGIPAVTCEVITPHGTIAEGSVEKSLSMMKSFLKYFALI